MRIPILVRRGLVLGYLFLLGLGAASGQGSGSTPPGRILLKLRPALARAAAAPARSAPEILSFLQRYPAQAMAPLYPGHVASRRFPARASRFRGSFAAPELSRTYVLELGQGSEPLARTLERLRAEPEVEWAEPDGTVSVVYTPNDPYLQKFGSWGQPYADLWGIQDIHAPAAWDLTTGKGVTVAVVDTGVDYTHPDIAANVPVHGWDFVHSRENAIDDHGHGTHVAGTIAAVGDNATGVVGVAWRAQILPVKVLDSSGSGLDSACAQGVVYAADHGADVISISWGGTVASNAIAEAIDYAYSQGVVIVAAAGNDNQDTQGFYPAAQWDVIAVAALDPKNLKAQFSNWGQRIDVAAPGVDILSLRANGTSMGTPVDAQYTRASGTSMATPHVSGMAALLLSLHPDFSNEQVRQALRSSAIDLGDSGPDTTFGYGGADAAAAVKAGTPLEARISSPVNGAIARVKVYVTGVARGAGFARYTLELGDVMVPASWTLIGSSTIPVNGTLGVLDADSVPNGTYLLRLTVYSTSGQKFIDQVRVRVDVTPITSPELPGAHTSAPTFKPGVVIPVRGVASGAGFQSFRVEWAPGIHPKSGWSSEGVTLANGGSKEITGLLANWDTKSITQAGYYTLRLTVTKAVTSEGWSIVYLEPDLYSFDWPRWLYRAAPAHTCLVPIRGADGKTELVASGELAWASVSFDQTPNVLWRLPLEGLARETIYPGSGSHTQVAAADLNGDGQDQVLIEDADSPNSALWKIAPDGSSVSWLLTGTTSTQMNQFAVEDLDGDGRWETLAFGTNYNQDTAPGKLFAWRPDGALASSNFPVTVDDQNRMRFSPQQRRFLVADLDNDGKREIVVAAGITTTTFQLKLLNSDGTARDWKSPVFDGQFQTMAAADLDHDGKLYVIVIARDAATADSLYVLRPDGSVRTGWPVRMGRAGSFQPFLAIGDLDRDGHDEIVAADPSGLYVLDADGGRYPGSWPLVRANGYQGLAIADIDGDGLPEILSMRVDQVTAPDPAFTHASYLDQKLIAFRRDGTISRQWQLNGMNGHDLGYAAMPTVGDFDQDGYTEIALAYGLYDNFAPNSGAATLLRTGATYHPWANPWPMLYHDARNTAVLKSGGPKIDTIENAASRRAGPIAPGELVLISVSGLNTADGHATAATTQGVTSLAGTRVLFGDTAAVLVYTQSGKVYAVVPSSVSGLKSVAVQVEFPGSLSDPVQVPVAATAPGMFTSNGLGTGAAVVRVPAGGMKAGATFSLFATGLEVSRVSMPAGPITVTVGTESATVSGMQPAGEGVLQVNVQAPADVATWNGQPVVLKIGTVSSQAGVTLSFAP